MDPDIHGTAISGFVVRLSTAGGDEEASVAQVVQRLNAAMEAAATDVLQVVLRAGTETPYFSTLKLQSDVVPGAYTLFKSEDGFVSIGDYNDSDVKQGEFQVDFSGFGGHQVSLIGETLAASRVFTLPNASGKLTATVVGTAAPATTPTSVGMFFVDTVAKKLYVSTGTASSADWTILN